MTLRRELNLRDITLFAISCIVGTRWIPAAAHAGPGSLTLWALAALFFVIPLAIAVGSHWKVTRTGSTKVDAISRAVSACTKKSGGECSALDAECAQ